MYRVRASLLPVLLLLALLAPSGSDCAELPNPPFNVSWELFALPDEAGVPGSGLLAVFWLTPDPGIYAYAHEAGGSGMPTVLRLTERAAGRALHVVYPPGTPQPDMLNPAKRINVYSSATPLFVEAGSAAPALEVEGTLHMLLCSDSSCWPVNASIRERWEDIDGAALPLAQRQSWWPIYRSASGAPAATKGEATTTIASPGPAVALPASTKAPGPASVALPELSPRFFQPGLEVTGHGKAALLGFLAGLILNFMPCVLPVVSLKLSAIFAAGSIRDERRRVAIFREHTVFFSVGVMCYFLLLALVLGSVDLAWGQLFQKPEVVLALTAVVFPLGLSLFGLFNLPVVDFKSGPDVADKPRTQALFTGFLATLLATPCSGPLLGGVLGWTLSQSPATVISVFLCIGLGMASPYLLMALNPRLIRLFPKPGAWTGHLEKLVGFFLMATCIYLLNILPQNYLLPGLTLLWTTAFAAWMWGQWTNLSHTWRRRLAVRGLAVLLVAGVAFWAVRPPQAEPHWQEFRPEVFETLLSRQPFVIDFTADWCPNCKVLEQTTLSDGRVEEWKTRYGLTFLRADLTEDNPFAQALLRALGSQSIPVVALFPSGDDSRAPLVLRDLFSPGQMDKALEQAFGPKNQPGGGQ